MAKILTTNKLAKFALIILCSQIFLPIKLAHAVSEFTLSVDKYYSPYMGSDWINAGWRGYQAIDDIVASGSVDNTSRCMTLVRTGKWLFEFSLASFAGVLQHELFGHGARAREFGIPDIGYHINIFSGATTYPLQAYNALNTSQRAALSTGGVEATSILAQQVEVDWVRAGSIDSRAATLYLINSLDTSVYAFGIDGNAFHPDNDAQAYMNTINAWFGSTVLDDNKLQTAAAWNWLNPMMYLSAWSVFKYVMEGHIDYDFATLHIGDARFMPTTRTYFAPYGPEYNLLLNLYTPQEKYLGINLRYANTHGKRAYGADLTVIPMITNECFHLVNRLSAWRQPHLLKNDTAATNTPKYGFGEFLAIYYRLAQGIFIKGELGYKVSGFIPGRQLASGVYWSVGIKFDVNVPTLSPPKTKVI